MIEIRHSLLTSISSAQPYLCARYILHLTYSGCRRNVLVNRVWLTPFSAPLESKPDLLKSTATNREQEKCSDDKSL